MNFPFRDSAQLAFAFQGTTFGRTYDIKVKCEPAIKHKKVTVKEPQKIFLSLKKQWNKITFLKII